MENIMLLILGVFISVMGIVNIKGKKIYQSMEKPLEQEH